jgi:predicted enzyme related to lactoylglutathione lyase
MAEQASEMAGWASPKHGSFCWTEIASEDADKCVAFYKEVFGWEFKSGDADGSNNGMDYREFCTCGDRPVGGLYQIDPKWFGDNPPPPHFMSYVAVDDIDENTKLAAELGATIIRGPMDIPGVGRIAILQDPNGAMIATFTMKN